MNQICEKLIIEIDFDEIEQKPIIKAKEEEAKNFNGISNPRYFEEVMSLKQAKRKLYAKYGISDIFNFNK